MSEISHRDLPFSGGNEVHHAVHGAGVVIRTSVAYNPTRTAVVVQFDDGPTITFTDGESYQLEHVAT